MSTTNSDPKVEKKSKFILAIAVVSIAIVVFLAYLVYNFLILPNLVQMSVSKNLDIYKNYSSESQKLLDKIESESKYVEVNEVQNSLKKIENIKPEVEKLSILKNDLNSGPTKNTQNFSKNLSSKMIADQSLKTYLNFKICLFEKYNKEGSSAFDQSGRAYLGKKSQSLSFEIDNFNYSLPYSGVPCSFYVSLQTGSQPLDTLSFAGIVSSKRSSVEAQGYIRSEFSLRQDFSHFKPLISDFTPRVILPGGTVTINGSNFINVKKILFGNTEASSFSVASTSSLTAVAPAQLKGAAPIYIETEETSSSSIFNFKTSVNKNDIRLSINFEGL
jgi:hypothetical protein